MGWYQNTNGQNTNDHNTNLIGILIGSVGILIGSVGILIGSVGILIHWYFEHWYFERWYFEPLPFNHLILSEFVQIFENYISHISRERHNRGLHRELHFSN